MSASEEGIVKFVKVTDGSLAALNAALCHFRQFRTSILIVTLINVERRNTDDKLTCGVGEYGHVDLPSVHHT